MTKTNSINGMSSIVSTFCRKHIAFLPVSWVFTNWEDSRREIVVKSDKEGKGVNRYVRVTFYNVIDIMSTGQRPKTFTTTSKRLLRKLFGYFEHGLTCLEITRTGEGTDTDYEIYPITLEKEEKQE